jgi:phosphatidylglycerol lysyltransferase
MELGEKRLRGARIWHLWPVAALAVGLWILAKRLEGVEPSHVLDALGAVSPAGWMGAIGATWLSLMAVGQYDAVLHRALKTGVSPRIARRTGLIGISIAQTAGFGTLVSALVRWRCLPDWSLWEAARFSLRVSLSFLLLWSLLAAVALALWPGAPDPAVWAAAVGLIAFGLVAGTPPLRRLAWRLIPRGSFGPLLAAALVDTVFAAVALAFLLPSGSTIGLELYPIYLLALGAALATGAPGGLGAFELVLLALLPHSDQAALIGAILAFRIIYYLLPAFLGLLGLLRPVAPLVAERQSAPMPSEWGLVRQGAAILRAGPALWLCRERLGLGIAIGPAFGPAEIGSFSRTMRRAGLVPVLYKAGRAEALAARSLGWQVLKVAEEAIVDPQKWSPEGSSRRQLRRHLRHAAQAGIRLEAPRHRLPIAEMAQVNTAWTLKNRRERGFSMGRFAPDLLEQQRVFLAYSRDRLLAFASFHAGAQDWSLDLVRHVDGIPDGTMHLLLTSAIETCRAEGISRLSLAAVPAAGETLTRLLPAAALAPGLRRFKQSFAPDWEPRYLCAAGTFTMTRAALTVAAAIHFPGPSLQRRPPRGPLSEIRFELPATSCDCDEWNPQPGQAATLPQITGPAHDRRPLPPS